MTLALVAATGATGAFTFVVAFTAGGLVRSTVGPTNGVFEAEV